MIGSSSARALTASHVAGDGLSLAVADGLDGGSLCLGPSEPKDVDVAEVGTNRSATATVARGLYRRFRHGTTKSFTEENGDP